MQAPCQAPSQEAMEAHPGAGSQGGVTTQCSSWTSQPLLGREAVGGRGRLPQASTPAGPGRAPAAAGFTCQPPSEDRPPAQAPAGPEGTGRLKRLGGGRVFGGGLRMQSGFGAPGGVIYSELLPPSEPLFAHCNMEAEIILTSKPDIQLGLRHL